MDASQATLFLARLTRLAIFTDDSPIEPEFMALARTQRLTIYDVAYLELACRCRLKLASLDRELRPQTCADMCHLIMGNAFDPNRLRAAAIGDGEHVKVG